MNFSPKEQTFICRGLDKASTETEVNICAIQLFRSLRERNVNGYDFIGQQSNSDQDQTEPPKDADGYQFYRDGFGWGCGRGRWGKWADGSTYWEDEQVRDTGSQTRVAGAVLKMVLLRHRSRIASRTLCVSSALDRHLRA
jgi:hypothetical protein